MEPTPWGTSRSVDIELIDPTGEVSRLEAEMVYSAADPYAVVTVFRSGPWPVRWVFARDLLADGLFAPAGSGDVQIWPSLDINARAVVVIELTSPHGEALLQAPAREVNEFLQRTFEMVPRGAEDMGINVDETVLQLLGHQDRVVE